MGLIKKKPKAKFVVKKKRPAEVAMEMAATKKPKFVIKKKAIAPTPPKPIEVLEFSAIAKVLDKIADRAGIGPEHIRSRPEILAWWGLEVNDIKHHMVHEAVAYHKYRMQKIGERIMGIPQ